jgi:hypothetical protein
MKLSSVNYSRVESYHDFANSHLRSNWPHYIIIHLNNSIFIFKFIYLIPYLSSIEVENL